MFNAFVEVIHSNSFKFKLIHSINSKVIQTFHDNIKCVPEYECTCCDQSRYQSSVRKCEGNKYPKCSQTLLEACITTIASIDNTKWTCSTCKSKLTSGKLQV